MMTIAENQTQSVSNANMTYQIQRCTMRELRTALEVWDKAEYGGGRERAADFLATVVRDALIGFSDPK